MKRNKGRKVLLFFALLALPFITHYFLPIVLIIRRPYNYLGIGLIIIWIVLLVKTSIMFKKSGNSFDLKSKSSQLMISGVYCYSRNPMYLGMLLWLIGTAVLLGSLSPFIYPFIFFVLINYMISYEEKKLERVYGDKYISYKKDVRRWI